MTQRSEAKADRRSALLGAASRLFAQSGFNGISIEDLGAAVGISGPAVYRHFSSKQAVLASLLITVSEHLLEGGRRVVTESDDPHRVLRQLISFHVGFALDEPDVIRVQDRDLDSLDEAARDDVRTLQTDYIRLWMRAVGALRPELDRGALQLRVQAVFGLINSTPHSARSRSRVVERHTVAAVLESMALAALVA